LFTYIPSPSLRPSLSPLPPRGTFDLSLLFYFTLSTRIYNISTLLHTRLPTSDYQLHYARSANPHHTHSLVHHTPFSHLCTLSEFCSSLDSPSSSELTEPALPPDPHDPYFQLRQSRVEFGRDSFLPEDSSLQTRQPGRSTSSTSLTTILI
jgi:hypothetical protein